MRYDFEAKDVYRRRLYACIEGMSSVHRERRVVGYLESPQALETEHLIRLGYTPANLYAINRSAAQVAWITRRCPGVNRMRGDIREAASYRFDVLNIDGMSCLHDNVLNAVGTAALNGTEVIAVTVLAGRESGAANAFLRNITKHPRVVERKTSFGTNASPEDVTRAAAIKQALGGHPSAPTCEVIKFKWDTYISETGRSRQKMLWVVGKVKRA